MTLSRGQSRGADARCLYGLNTQHDPGGIPVGVLGRENRWRGERVHQAAREALSATLTPSTAAGGAEGERWTG
jgi:hypothetical protein